MRKLVALVGALLLAGCGCGSGPGPCAGGDSCCAAYPCPAGFSCGGAPLQCLHVAAPDAGARDGGAIDAP
jgi:hypothetical protein